MLCQVRCCVCLRHMQGWCDARKKSVCGMLCFLAVLFWDPRQLQFVHLARRSTQRNQQYSRFLSLLRAFVPHQVYTMQHQSCSGCCAVQCCAGPGPDSSCQQLVARPMYTAAPALAAAQVLAVGYNHMHVADACQPAGPSIASNSVSLV